MKQDFTGAMQAVRTSDNSLTVWAQSETDVASLTTFGQNKRHFFFFSSPLQFKQDVCTQADLYAKSQDGNKQMDGWMKQETFPYLIPLVSESKGEARVIAEVLR